MNVWLGDPGPINISLVNGYTCLAGAWAWLGGLV